jgi:hypothetical protein
VASTSTGGTGSLLGSVEMPYDSRNEWRVAKKQLRKMRQKSLPSGPPSVELQAPIPGVLSWMMIAIARCHKEPRAIVCSIGSTIGVQGAIDLAFVESIQVIRAVFDAILCVIQVKRASTLPSAGPSKSSEPSSVPSVPEEEEDERSGPLWRVLVLVALVVCWEVSKIPYDSRNEWRVAKKHLRKMRQKSLPSGPPSVELQAPIPGVLSWMMIAIARCRKEPRAIVCSIGRTIRVQGAVDLAFVESIQVNRGVVDAILCAI